MTVTVKEIMYGQNWVDQWMKNRANVRGTMWHEGEDILQKFRSETLKTIITESFPWFYTPEGGDVWGRRASCNDGYY